jgi:hypothetical protein
LAARPGNSKEILELVVRNLRSTFLVLVVALFALAAIPAFAAAQVFVVNGTEDTQTQAECENELGGECTLRGAIEAVNAGNGNNQVEFSSTVFHGTVGEDEITLTEELPAIQVRTTIFGGQLVGGLYAIPTVGLVTPSGKAGLTVEAADVTIEGIAFEGGKYGIDVTNASTNTKIKASWFGLKLDATAAPITTAGVLIGPGSDGTKIGEAEEESRNVFTHAPYGIEAEGASETVVRGNYIGVGPSGKTGGAIERGLWVTDAAGFPAVKTVIGGERESATGTADCGSACNVIVASRVGIDLTGQTSKSLGSATGPTTISGNYIGLEADGSQYARLTGSFGIFAAPPVGATASEHGPGKVTIGGSKAGEANVIDNGGAGLIFIAGENLVARGNLVGWLPATGTAGSDPEEVGFVVGNEGVGDPPEVLDNKMYLGANAVGVESFGPGAQIVGNQIFGSETGVLTAEDDTGVGNQIVGNLIEGADLYGVLLENNVNAVTGNTIIGAGRSGVITDLEDISNPWPTANRIGGDLPALENLIEGSVESAISIGGEPETTNEILGNFGLANGGPFIELREHSAGHPTNEEIKPPTLEAVYESSASGTAKAGAKVRIFGKPSTDPGSLERMIGSATADASGHWTVTFATKLLVGKLVAATQTTAAGTPLGATSEVSAPTAAVADPVLPVTPGQSTDSGSSDSSQTPATTTTKPPAPTAPKVKITKGPKKSSEATKATFKFKAEPAAGATFECKLDGKKWRSASRRRPTRG